MSIRAQAIDEEQLIEELRRLRRALEEAAPVSGRDSEELLAVALLRPGLDLERWREIAEERGLHDWLAIPGHSGDYPLLRRLSARLQRLAHDSEHDELTGLYNRRAFERRVRMEMERSRRLQNPLSLAIVDIDDFKAVNDRHGHAKGDEALEALADTLESQSRKINTTARIGGEEFAILAPGTGPLQARAMTMRLQRHFSRRGFRAAGEEFSLTFSAGVSTYRPGSGLPAGEFVHQADRALLEAKRQGKARTVCAEESLSPLRARGTISAEERELLFKSGSGASGKGSKQ